MSRKPKPKREVCHAAPLVMREEDEVKPAGPMDFMAKPAPQTYPMSPQEAHQIGTLQAQMAQLNAAFEAVGNAACARLGLAIGTRLNANPQQGIYTVGG